MKKLSKLNSRAFNVPRPENNHLNTHLKIVNLQFCIQHGFGQSSKYELALFYTEQSGLFTASKKWGHWGGGGGGGGGWYLCQWVFMTYLSTLNTRPIFPIARILFRMTSFLLAASFVFSSSSVTSSSSSSVQMFRMFTNISVTVAQSRIEKKQN